MAKRKNQVTKLWLFGSMCFSAKTEKWLKKQAKKGLFLCEIHGNRFTFKPGPPRDCWYFFVGRSRFAQDWMRQREQWFYRVIDLCGKSNTVCADTDDSQLAVELKPGKIGHDYWITRRKLYESYEHLPKHMFAFIAVFSVILILFNLLNKTEISPGFIVPPIMLLYAIPHALMYQELQNLKIITDGFAIEHNRQINRR